MRNDRTHVLEITASEFKAKCLDLLDRVAARKVTRIIVTKRGRPVAQLGPMPRPAEEVESLFGCMRERTVVPAGVDLTAPVLDEPLDAEQGRLHE